jgi:hypothetical protein
MTLLPLFNATLTLVQAPGSSPDYDQPAAPGATKFSGAERVFWDELSERVTQGTESDVLVRRSMYVDPADVAVAWTQGDLVTASRDGFGTSTATVRRHDTNGSAETGYIVEVVFEDA